MAGATKTEESKLIQNRRQTNAWQAERNNIRGAAGL